MSEQSDISDISWAEVVDAHITTDDRMLNKQSDVIIDKHHGHLLHRPYPGEILLPEIRDDIDMHKNIIVDINDNNYQNTKIEDLICQDHKTMRQSEMLNFQLQLINYIRKNMKLLVFHNDQSNEIGCISKVNLIEKNIAISEKMIDISKYLCELTNLPIIQDIKSLPKSIHKLKASIKASNLPLKINGNDVSVVENSTDLSNQQSITGKPDILPRSSYKFCEFNYECEFNYGNKDRRCYAQHFVHNSVYHDLLVLLNYFSRNKNNISCLNIHEINKTLNTLIFVINHMLNEIRLVEFYQLESDLKKKKVKVKNVI